LYQLIGFLRGHFVDVRVIPMMLKAGGGRIVNVSGKTGIMVTNPPFLSSCTGPAKSAEIRLSRILANEFAMQKYPGQLRGARLRQYAGAVREWERELARHQLPDEEAGKMREQWSLNQASRNTRWGTRWTSPKARRIALTSETGYIR
jgi:3-oxoacyl-[acyl-carrier protein] reductase